MNTATPLLDRPVAGLAGEELHLTPLSSPHGRVRSLDCAPGPQQLHVLLGRIWLTVEGQPEDHLLSAGQTLAVQGPARLHLSAEGARSARVTLRPRDR